MGEDRQVRQRLKKTLHVLGDRVARTARAPEGASQGGGIVFQPPGEGAKLPNVALQRGADQPLVGREHRFPRLKPAGRDPGHVPEASGAQAQGQAPRLGAVSHAVHERHRRQLGKMAGRGDGAVMRAGIKKNHSGPQGLVERRQVPGPAAGGFRRRG